MFHKTVRLVAHRGIRITYEIFSVLAECQSGEKIDLAVQEHLVKIAEFPVNIFVVPSGIFRELLIVFIGIPGLDRTFLRTLLENLILVIADAHLVACCFGSSYVKREYRHKDQCSTKDYRERSKSLLEPSYHASNPMSSSLFSEICLRYGV